MTTPVRMYVDPSWKREGKMHTPLLYPFWGNPITESSLFAKQLFDAYQYNTDLYTITDSIKKADMVLIPYRYNSLLEWGKDLLDACVKLARQNDLPLLIDGTGDIEYPVPYTNAYILRIGGYRFIPERGRIVIPPYADDLLERCCNSKLEVREKNAEPPIVGFAGWAKLSVSQSLRTSIKEMPIRLRGLINERYRAHQKGVFWRMRAIAILSRSNAVRTNFRLRDSFSGSTKTAEKNMVELRQEFVDTVLQSDYCLDVRGDANASTRLFEILSLGRIPIIVDTERNFPFSDVLDYSAFSLIVDFRDIEMLPQKIAEFHASILPEQFQEMQKKAREAYVNFFRVDALMKHILREITTRPPSP